MDGSRRRRHGCHVDIPWRRVDPQRVIRSWRRGTPLEEATTVFEGEQSDISVSQYAYRDHGVAHEFRVRSLTFYTSKHANRAEIESVTRRRRGQDAEVLRRRVAATPRPRRRYSAETLARLSGTGTARRRISRA